MPLRGNREPLQDRFLSVFFFYCSADREWLVCIRTQRERSIPRKRELIQPTGMLMRRLRGNLDKRNSPEGFIRMPRMRKKSSRITRCLTSCI